MNMSFTRQRVEAGILESSQIRGVGLRTGRSKHRSRFCEVARHPERGLDEVENAEVAGKNRNGALGAPLRLA
jgi:hypothetical protein